MYRYTVDNAVTYTSEDFVLFRESPFACWMERLTLENPDHGIPPDIGSTPPGNTMESQQELADTLISEGRDVLLVPWDADEPSRRSATLAAMREGIDFIVDGQLALGPLSGSANLLMRTAGFSELGNYLYMPCDTTGRTTLQSAFRLCFLADLLHSLQGQLPPQMLIIRGSGDLLQLQTDDHIYHYRAVKQRFMTAMREFRKHRMPDPAESSHFGRWAECANEVLRQRALREEQGAETEQQEAEEQAPVPEPEATPMPIAANAQAQTAEPREQSEQPQQPVRSEGTLAEQARQLQPGTYTTERTPAPYDHKSRPWAANQSPAQVTAAALEGALENLEFIGSSDRGKRIGARPEAPSAALGPEPVEEPPEETPGAEEPQTTPQPVAARFSGHADLYPQPSQERKPHPLDCNDSAINVDPVIDRDEGNWARSTSSPAPTLQTGNREFEVDCVDDSDYSLPNGSASTGEGPSPTNPAESTAQARSTLDRDPTGRHPVAIDVPRRDPLDYDPTGRNPVGRSQAAFDPIERDPTGRKPGGRHSTDGGPEDGDADLVTTRPFNSSLITNSDNDD